jgi:tRNA (adenine22-N1)-methyltransferase
MGPSVLFLGLAVNEESIRACAQKPKCGNFWAMSKLSPRLQLIYDQLIPGKPVWDICCDHGYLGLKAYQAGAFPQVYFVDQVDSIIEKLKTSFREEFLQADFHQQAYFISSRAEELPREVTGTAVIAGVGAYTIFKILCTLESKSFLQAQKLILVPQRDEQKLQELLKERHCFGYKSWTLAGEVQERGRSRRIFVLE